MPPTVRVPRPLPGRVEAELSRRFRVVDEVAGAEGLVALLSERVDDELLDAAGERLRVVANFAVGVDNVDVEAATRRGIVVANTPDVLTRATAELTIALLLALVRRVVEGDRLVRAREPWGWGPTFMLGSGLAGRTLGVVGLGRIGTAVAVLAQAFGMDVVYSARRPRQDGPWRQVSLGTLLEACDVVSLHAPLTPETRHLIGAAELSAMKPGAVLVNTARGALLDESALADALESGEIAGAALDVFEREPEVEARLLTLRTVVLTPHLGSATTETREAMGMLCVEALTAVLLEGRLPANVVNRDVRLRA